MSAKNLVFLYFSCPLEILEYSSSQGLQQGVKVQGCSQMSTETFERQIRVVSKLGCRVFFLKDLSMEWNSSVLTAD